MRKIFVAQAIFVLLLAALWGAFDHHVVPSVLCGGIACIAPSVFLAYVFFSKKHTRRPRQILVAFYIGEFVKMIISALLIIASIMYLHAELIALVAGFFAANMAFWIVPTFMMKKQVRST